jgi:hypothetical protein
MEKLYILSSYLRKRISYKYYYIIIIIILFSPLNYLTQNIYSQSVSDSLQSNLKLRAEPNYITAAAEVFGFNMTVWAYDRFIYQVEWAKISWNTMRENLKHGFVLDEDGFETNQFAHPYHGSFSFTAARSSGINFWKSVPYPFAGSLMWELFMETEYPSINDLITTPMSGIILGETSFRISNLVLYSGKKSILREIAAFILSPMSGLNRLLYGKDVHSFRIKNKHPEYNISFSGGLNGVILDEDFSQKLPHLYLKFYLQYGRYAEIKKNYKPFDYFETEVGLSLSRINTIIEIQSSGLLLGKKIRLKSRNKAVIGIFQSFDFLDNRIYKISATAVGAGFLTRYYFKQKNIWDNTLTLSIIAMGGLNPLYVFEGGRDYNLGPGAKIKYESYFSFINQFGLFLKYKYYWIYPLKGARGNEYVDILRLGAQFKITYAHSLNIEFIEYDRWSNYTNFPDQQDNTYAMRIFYSYSFN